MRDEWKDTMILTWRCCLLSLRNPDTLLTSVMLPGLMMALFVFLFGTFSPTAIHRREKESHTPDEPGGVVKEYYGNTRFLL